MLRRLDFHKLLRLSIAFAVAQTVVSVSMQVAAATIRLLHAVLSAVVQPFGVAPTAIPAATAAVAPAQPAQETEEAAATSAKVDWEGLWSALPRPCQENLCELLRVVDDTLPSLQPPQDSSQGAHGGKQQDAFWVLGGCLWAVLRLTAHARVRVRAPSFGKRAAAFVTATLSATSGDAYTAAGTRVGSGSAGTDGGAAGADESSTVRRDDRPLRVAGRLVTP
jgi:hypothetical protein